MSYTIEREQRIRIILIDGDYSRNDFKVLGKVETSLSMIIRARKMCHMEYINVQDIDYYGRLLIRASSVSSPEKALILNIRLNYINNHKKKRICLGICSKQQRFKYGLKIQRQ
jgi:hypothetical protein